MQSKYNSATHRLLQRHTCNTSGNLRCLLGGKWMVPDTLYDDFLALYADDVLRHTFGYVECRNELFPYLLDLDFYAGTQEQRLQLLHLVLRVLHDTCIQPFLLEYTTVLQVVDPLRTAQESVWGACLSHRKGLKYHVIFPALLVDTIQGDFITQHLTYCLTQAQPDLDWTKIVDRKVVTSNGLRMLGSYKKDTAAGCYVPCTVDWDSCVLTEHSITLATLRDHSVHLTTESIAQQNRVPLHKLKPNQPHPSASTPPSPLVTEGGSSTQGAISYTVLETAVMGLPPKFYGRDSYSLWYRTIWAIRNTSMANNFDANGLQLAHKFSAQDATVYDSSKVESLWARGGSLIGFGTIMHHLKENNTACYDRVRAILASQAPPAEAALWQKESLQARLEELLPGLQGAYSFTFEPTEIKFHCGEVSGTINKSDGGVFVADTFKGYLAEEVTLQRSLTLLHKDIQDDMSWNLAFQDPERATLTTDTGSAAIQWTHPWAKDSYLTVSFNGARRGNAIQNKKALDYLQKTAETAVMAFLKDQYGITQAHFQNCVFNFNIVQVDERHGDDQLVAMWMAAHPDITRRYRFSPDVKSASCNGLYLADPVTNIWSQVHNAVVETTLRTGFASVPDLHEGDKKFIRTRRGIQDLRYEFAAQVLESRFDEKLDTNLDLFAVANGVLDVPTKTFRPIVPEDYIRHYADWEYIPNTDRSDLEHFLAQLLPIEQERKVVLSYLAGLLSGRRYIKKLLILTDKRAGNNGKSSLVLLLQSFFSSYARSSSKFVCSPHFQKDRDSHDAGMEPYVGCRLAIAEELKRHNILAEGHLKNLTGGAGLPVNGRRCGSSEEFKFVWTAGIILVFNEGDCPEFDVGDGAFIGRMLVAPMRSKFVPGGNASDEEYTYEADPTVAERFPAWRSGLLDLLLEHYRETDFKPAELPRDMLEWRTDIVDQTNGLGDWLAETVEITDNKKDYVLMSELKAMYKNQQDKPVKEADFIRVAKAWFLSQGAVYPE